MTRPRSRLRSLYGASGLHLLVTLAALSLFVYTVLELGLDELWDPEVWWQSILVWFLGAVLLHDLILFPLYALADRFLGASLLGRSAGSRSDAIPLLNYVRVPVLAIALTFLLFFPGILEQGASSYERATGQSQEPFLGRWLILSASFFGLSAISYAVRLMTRLR